MPITVKVAETESEFAQIHAINLQVYALELGQDQAPEGAEQLVDPRLDRTVYIIAKEEDVVVGMFGLTPPGVRFSLEDSLEEGAIPEEERAESIELRRLAVLPAYRGHRIFPRMMLFLADYAAPRGYRIAYLSAIESRIPDYRRLGLRPFGALFQKGSVRYLPMRVYLAEYRAPTV